MLYVLTEKRDESDAKNVHGKFVPIVTCDTVANQLLRVAAGQAERLDSHREAVGAKRFFSGRCPIPQFYKKHEKGDNSMRKRGQKISFWTTEKEQEKIRRLAKSVVMGEGEYLRRAALGKQILQVSGLDEILRELKAIGRNLNQITLLSHMGKITAPNLRSVAEALERNYAAIDRLLTVPTGEPTDGDL